VRAPGGVRREHRSPQVAWFVSGTLTAHRERLGEVRAARLKAAIGISHSIEIHAEFMCAVGHSEIDVAASGVRHHTAVYHTARDGIDDQCIIVVRSGRTDTHRHRIGPSSSQDQGVRCGNECVSADGCGVGEWDGGAHIGFIADKSVVRPHHLRIAGVRAYGSGATAATTAIAAAEEGACPQGGVEVARAVAQEGAGTRLQVTLTGPGLRPEFKEQAKSRMEKILGLRVDLAPFYRMASHDAKLLLLVEKFRGVKPPRFPTIFETLANAFACQQLSLEVGLGMLSRMASACGLSLEQDGETSYAFPRPEDLLELGPGAIRELGFSGNKTLAFLELAGNIVSGRTNFDSLEKMDNEAVVASLLELRGVGRWTADTRKYGFRQQRLETHLRSAR
jgi:hypothetical protein